MKRIIPILAVVCFVLAMAVPAFAYTGDIENYPAYSGDYPYEGGGYVIYVDLDAEASGYKVYYMIRWFENPSSLSAFYDADNNLKVNFDGSTSYRYYAYADGSPYVTSWSEPVADPGTGFKLFDIAYSDFIIYFENGTQAFPTLPPLVKALEGAEMMEVLVPILTILPIGLGCLVGYKGLRKALALLRGILLGA